MRPWIVYIYVDNKGYPLSKNLEQKKVEERNMANSSYTFAQVVSGTGFFSKSQDTGYAVGVRDLQTYLRNIGYTISDANYAPDFFVFS